MKRKQADYEKQPTRTIRNRSGLTAPTPDKHESQEHSHKKDGTECQGMTETMKRWEEWAAECCSEKPDRLTSKIVHIPEQECAVEEMQIDEALRLTRQQEALRKIIQEEPDAETWLNSEYDEQDIGREIRNLANRKAHGSDGIPGEAYKATRTWAIKHITKIKNAIKTGGKYLKIGHMEP